MNAISLLIFAGLIGSNSEPLTPDMIWEKNKDSIWDDLEHVQFSRITLGQKTSERLKLEDKVYHLSRNAYLVEVAGTNNFYITQNLENDGTNWWATDSYPAILSTIYDAERASMNPASRPLPYFTEHYITTMFGAKAVRLDELKSYLDSKPTAPERVLHFKEKPKFEFNGPVQIFITKDALGNPDLKYKYSYTTRKDFQESPGSASGMLFWAKNREEFVEEFFAKGLPIATSEFGGDQEARKLIQATNFKIEVSPDLMQDARVSNLVSAINLKKQEPLVETPRIASGARSVRADPVAIPDLVIIPTPVTAPEPVLAAATAEPIVIPPKEIKLEAVKPVSEEPVSLSAKVDAIRSLLETGVADEKILDKNMIESIQKKLSKVRVTKDSIKLDVSESEYRGEKIWNISTHLSGSSLEGGAGLSVGKGNVGYSPDAVVKTILTSIDESLEKIMNNHSVACTLPASSTTVGDLQNLSRTIELEASKSKPRPESKPKRKPIKRMQFKHNSPN